eukprot:c22065_g1_i1.p1 GENE.c22065_g1_i1~~c22065_g1_i1.p1  ORF type:complete len:362 (-),score=111.82 c22065_g1_i1:76-1113(-)
MAKLAISLGTMTFGWTKSSTFLDQEKSTELTLKFAESNYVEIDTALLYSEGESEKMIGKMLKEHPDKLKNVQIATKINPFNTNSLESMNTGKVTPGGFVADKVKSQVNQCLTSLGVDKVSILYLHLPDPETPIEETLKALDELHKQNKFEELGLSNYAAWEVCHIYHICSANGWVKPTVYQGMYNAVTRGIETELIPVCHRFGIRVRVYNPLAGGMLTGKHNGMMEQGPTDGRFKGNQNYQNRYWKPSFFKAMDLVKEACDRANLTMTEASFIWLQSHSKLSSAHNDGIILGVSSLNHLESNMKACSLTQTLPDDVLKALNDAWDIVKGDCPPYFRSWSNMKNTP